MRNYTLSNICACYRRLNGCCRNVKQNTSFVKNWVIWSLPGNLDICRV